MAFENSEYKLETVTSIRSWIYTGDQANARSLVRARLTEPRAAFCTTSNSYDLNEVNRGRRCLSPSMGISSFNDQ